MNIKQITLIQGIILGILFIVPLYDIIKECPYELVYPYDYTSIFKYAGFLSSDRIGWVLREQWENAVPHAISFGIDFIIIKYLAIIIGIILSLYFLRDEKK